MLIKVKEMHDSLLMGVMITHINSTNHIFPSLDKLSPNFRGPPEFMSSKGLFCEGPQLPVIAHMHARNKSRAFKPKQAQSLRHLSWSGSTFLELWIPSWEATVGSRYTNPWHCCCQCIRLYPLATLKGKSSLHAHSSLCPLSRWPTKFYSTGW